MTLQHMVTNANEIPFIDVSLTQEIYQDGIGSRLPEAYFKWNRIGFEPSAVHWDDKGGKIYNLNVPHYNFHVGR